MDVKVKTVFNREFQQTYYEVSCPAKRKEPFLIVPHPKGYSSWIIKSPSGDLPKVLGGSWGRQPVAVDMITSYFKNMRVTQATKRKPKKNEDS